MAEKGPPAPTPKPVRKPVTQAKVKEPSQKNLPKQNPSKAAHPLEPRIVVVPVVPIDQLEDQAPLYPPNQPNQLPDNPPDQPNQLPDNPSNPPNPPPIPPNLPPNLPNPPPDPPANPPNPIQPQNPPFKVPQFNWSYFKPEFSGKPEEDAVAHLLRTNDWMETHNFLQEAKVQRFCLTLTGEARLWYESLRPIEIDWPTLQEYFRQQYSKFGNTKEQYFHTWRSFHYDENTDTIDSYVSKIKQVTTLLNYGEPQILELFNNTLPSKLYWIVFPINNLQEVVDATKRVLTKEKLDKQLSGQTANSTPFMKMEDTVHPGKKMLNKPQDAIEERLENLRSMMHKMSIQQGEGKKPFKPQVYPKRGRGQRRQNFGNRDRSRNNDRQILNFRHTQNGHRNGNRRGNYRQNIGRSNSRDRGRQNFRRNYNNNDRSRSRERSPTPRRYITR